MDMTIRCVEVLADTAVTVEETTRKKVVICLPDTQKWQHVKTVMEKNRRSDAPFLVTEAIQWAWESAELLRTLYPRDPRLNAIRYPPPDNVEPRPPGNRRMNK